VKSVADCLDLIRILRAALADALPYIESAYECAFPDAAQNQEIANAAKLAIDLSDDLLPPHK